jgi:hypothetical protein
MQDTRWWRETMCDYVRTCDGYVRNKDVIGFNEELN